MRSTAWQIMVVGLAALALSACDGFDPSRCDDGSYKEDHVDDDCEKPERWEEGYDPGPTPAPPSVEFRTAGVNAGAYEGHAVYAYLVDYYFWNYMFCGEAVITSGGFLITSGGPTLSTENGYTIRWVIDVDGDGSFKTEENVDLAFGGEFTLGGTSPVVQTLDVATATPLGDDAYWNPNYQDGCDDIYVHDPFEPYSY